MTPLYFMLAGGYAAAAAVWVNIWHHAREQAEWRDGGREKKGPTLVEMRDGV